MAWAALQEEGARYRVYLNFLAMQANGERIQTRSYQFIVDLRSKAVRADDPATEQDLLTQNAELNFKHNPMATDIDSILGGVDTYNKHQVQMIIIRKNRSNRDERTQIETALKTAKAKIQRSIIYFAARMRTRLCRMSPRPTISWTWRTGNNDGPILGLSQ